MTTMAAMNAKKAKMASISCGQHVKVLPYAWYDWNMALIYGHSNNEFIIDDVFHPACIAGGSFLAVFKEYFQPLSDS